jgi:hypothetical protein
MSLAAADFSLNRSGHQVSLNQDDPASDEEGKRQRKAAGAMG